MVDFIVVGGGLAGMAFTETAWREGMSVVVFDTGLRNASRVASGLYNPVVLKRLTAVSNAEAYLDVMESFYGRLQDRFEQTFFRPTPLWRKFSSIEEQNNWFAAADSHKLSPFLNTNLVYDKVDGIGSPFDYGLVNRTGWLDTRVLLDGFWQNVPAGSHYHIEPFIHSELSWDKEFVHYQNIRARHIVFAEGTALAANPFFNHLPLQGTKGELVYIKAEGLNLHTIVNAGIFILPMGDSIFKVGATYTWNDLTDKPTEKARTEILEKLNAIISVRYEVIDHLAGIRPTVSDRKPLVGTHPDNARLHILNGLGTRGILLAPLLAQNLYRSIQQNVPLPAEIDIRRFKNAVPRSE